MGALRIACLVLMISQSVGARNALGHEASARAGTDAEAFVNRGLDMRERGEDEAALHEFRHAQEMSPSPRTLAQIALAEQALGRWVQAELHLTEALRAATNKWIAANTKTLSRALEDIRSRLGSLDIRQGPPGAEVRLDGLLVGTLPLRAPLRAVAGTVALEVTAPGFFPVQRTVVVPANGMARENLELVRVADRPSVPDAVATTNGIPVEPSSPMPLASGPETRSGSGWGWQKTAGVVALGLGGASLILGATFHMTRESRAEAFRDAPCFEQALSEGMGCQQKLDAVHSAEAGMLVGYLSAGVLAAAGTYFLVSAPRGATETEVAKARMICRPGLYTVGFTCGGAF